LYDIKMYYYQDNNNTGVNIYKIKNKLQLLLKTRYRLKSCL